MNRFISYDIRPCASFGFADGSEYTESFVTTKDRDEQVQDTLDNHYPSPTYHSTFWSLYGRYKQEGYKPLFAMSIGDYNTIEAALEIYCRITGYDKSVFVIDPTSSMEGLPA